MAPCAVCTVHVETESTGFLVKPQNVGRRFVSRLASKPLGWFLGWASKPRRWRVSWFGPQNHAGFSLSVVPQNRWEDATVWDTCRDLAACFTWKQVWLGFPSLASRLAVARRWVVHVAPSRRLCQSQVEDGRVDATGCVGPCYPCFVVFTLLGTGDIVVI
jgi:hypothetical protein